MAVSRSWILSLKVFFLSIGVLSIAMLMKFSVPLIIDFIIYQLPSIWAFMASWMRPPYLYLVINCIIISILASSRFQSRSDPSENLLNSSPIDLEFELQSEEESRSEFDGSHESRSEFDGSQESRSEFVGSNPSSKEMINDNSEAEYSVQEEEFVISRSNWTPSPRTASPEIQNSEEEERPMAVSRFSNRKPAKVSPEGGRGLKVAKKPRKNETLENTWKAITDGRHVPLTRHLKKSDTLENHGRQVDVNESPKNRIMKKSETFRDRTNYYNNSPPSSTSVSPSPRTGKARKEPTLSHDELNRRVEAFIKKFNDEMRLQRQESLRQYSKIIGAGIR